MGMHVTKKSYPVFKAKLAVLRSNDHGAHKVWQLVLFKTNYTLEDIYC